MKNLIIVMLLSCVFVFAQDHAPTVPPDPDDGGCCTCGFWACLIGTCQNMPCHVKMAKIPIMPTNPLLNYTPAYPLANKPAASSKEQPPPTNQTFPDQPNPEKVTKPKLSDDGCTWPPYTNPPCTCGLPCTNIVKAK
jgi:hypothetical protein